MHELAITQSMLDIVQEQAENAGAKKVGKINLVIGKMTGVVEECVRFYFDFLGKGTIVEGATLSFKIVPIVARCQGCKKSFKLRELDWSCPNCQGNVIKIVSGKELFVESIEVE
jgi:hydrogenase nickel incorporation protein HypA/HybF